MEKSNQEKRLLKIGFITLSQEGGTASEFHKTLIFIFLAILLMVIIFNLFNIAFLPDINPKEIIDGFIQKFKISA